MSSLLDKFKGISKPTGSATSFLPEDYLQAKVETRANVLCLILLGAVLLAVTSTFFVTHQAWNSVREQQRRISQEYAEQTQKIEQLKKLETQKTEMLEKAEMAAALNERVPRSILLAEIINRMPDRVTLTDMELRSRRVVEAAPPPTPRGARDLSASKGGAGAGKGSSAAKAAEPPKPKPPRFEYTLTLTGLATNDELVADFQAALKDCALLQRVDLVSSVAEIVDQVNARKFRIEAQIRPSADARKFEPLQVARENDRDRRVRIFGSSLNLPLPAQNGTTATATVPTNAFNNDPTR